MALATPLNADGHVDEEGLQRLLQRVLAGHVHGVSPVGSTGEGARLTTAQRLKVTARVRADVPVDLPVIPGVPLITVAEGREELDALAGLGATAALVAPPAYYPLCDTDVRRLYEALADESPLPLLLYNIPSFTKIRIAPEIVGELAAHSNIVGVKDSSRDMEYLVQVLGQVADEGDFSVLTGTDSLLVPSLAVGAHGAIAASANLVPDLATEIYHAFTSGDGERALRLQQRLVRVVTTCRCGDFPAGWKAALSIVGVCNAYLAAPASQLDPSLRRSLEEDLAVLGIGPPP